MILKLRTEKQKKELKEKEELEHILKESMDFESIQTKFELDRKYAGEVDIVSEIPELKDFKVSFNILTKALTVVLENNLSFIEVCYASIRYDGKSTVSYSLKESKIEKQVFLPILAISVVALLSSTTIYLARQELEIAQFALIPLILDVVSFSAFLCFEWFNKIGHIKNMLKEKNIKIKYEEIAYYISIGYILSVLFGKIGEIKNLASIFVIFLLVLYKYKNKNVDKR